ncbi:MAG: hypothetical protein AAFQ51_05825 [Pseudomonadota bacterium]
MDRLFLSAQAAMILCAPLVLLSLAPVEGPVLVIVPPWADASALVTSAGGQPVGAPFVTFATLATGDVGAIRAGGGWILTGGLISFLCGGPA